MVELSREEKHEARLLLLMKLHFCIQTIHRLQTERRRLRHPGRNGSVGGMWSRIILLHQLL